MYNTQRQQRRKQSASEALAMLIILLMLLGLSLILYFFSTKGFCIATANTTAVTFIPHAVLQTLTGGLYGIVVFVIKEPTLGY